MHFIIVLIAIDLVITRKESCAGYYVNLIFDVV